VLPEQDAVARVLPAVIHVSQPEGIGTGLVLGSGYALTNAHVVQNYATVQIRTQDGRMFTATVERRDTWADLALLRVPDDLPGVSLGDAAQLRVGEPLIAIGYSLDLHGGPTVTRGIFSARRSARGVDYIQTDAAINPGDSGGPLISLHGDVIGINAMRLEADEDGTPVQGVNFAISTDAVRSFVDNKPTAGTTSMRDDAPVKGPSPVAGPDAVVRQYYTAVALRRLDEAYRFMGPKVTSTTDRLAFDHWFDNKLSLTLVSISAESPDVDTAIVVATVTSEDRFSDSIQAIQRADYVDRWTLSRQPDGWRMEAVQTTLANGVLTSVATELRRAIIEYDHLEERARSAMDASLLHSRATASVIDSVSKDIASRRQRGERENERLEAILLRGFRQPSSDRAEVDAVETWSSAFYSLTGLWLRGEPAHQIPMTMTLVRDKGQWLLSSAHYYKPGQAPF